MRELERRVLLSVLDRKWREHLYEMDYLREGIYLRAYSQRDPLVEYQREGFDMFAAMMDGIKEEAVGFLFNLDVQVEEDEDEGEFHYHDDGPATTARCTRARSLSRRSRSRCGADPVGDRSRSSGPRASRRPSSRRTSPTPRPREDGEVEVKGRRSPTPTTRSPRSDATPSAPAARARSTSGATVPRVGRPA